MNRHVLIASLVSWVLLVVVGCRFDHPGDGADAASAGKSGGYGGASTSSSGMTTSTGGAAGSPTGTGGVACDGSVAPPDGGTIGPMVDAATIDGASPPSPDAGGSSDAGTGTAHIRLANFGSQNTSFDFCARKHDPANSSPYDIGPVLASRGVASGILQQQVTAYIDFAPGQYDFRLVGPNAPDCTKPLSFNPVAPFLIPYDVTDAPNTESDTWWTFIAHGSGNHGNAFSKFQDEHAPAPEHALVRYANVTSFDRAMDFGFGTDASFSPVFTNVAFRQVGAGEGVDALGYLRIAPVSQQFAVDRFTGGAGDVGKLLVDLPSGDVASFFGFDVDFMVVCHDLAPPKGWFSDCQGKPGFPADAGGTTPPPSDAGLPDVPDHGSIPEF
jgi:hypothetical protein